MPAAESKKQTALPRTACSQPGGPVERMHAAWLKGGLPALCRLADKEETIFVEAVAEIARGWRPRRKADEDGA